MLYLQQFIYLEDCLMLLNKKSVELLAPAGNWETLVAAIDAGADAIYLGGKHFNMRMLKSDANFDNEMLKKAVECFILLLII